MVFVGRGIEAATGPTGLVALSVTDGRLVWSFELPDGHQVHAGAVDSGRVYAVAGDGHVYGLDSASGTVQWQHDTGARIATLAGFVDGRLYVANSAGSVRALDAATGELEWEVLVNGEPSLPAVVNGRVFLGTTLGRVVAIGGIDDPP